MMDRPEKSPERFTPPVGATDPTLDPEEQKWRAGLLDVLGELVDEDTVTCFGRDFDDFYEGHERGEAVARQVIDAIVESEKAQDTPLIKWIERLHEKDYPASSILSDMLILPSTRLSETDPATGETTPHSPLSWIAKGYNTDAIDMAMRGYFSDFARNGGKLATAAQRDEPHAEEDSRSHQLERDTHNQTLRYLMHEANYNPDETSRRESLNAFFKELNEPLEKLVTSIAITLSKHNWNWQDFAQDLGQEVRLRVFKSMHKFDGRSRVMTWIHSIARNTALNMIKSNAKHDHGTIDSEDDYHKGRTVGDHEPDPSVEDKILTAIMRDELTAVIEADATPSSALVLTRDRITVAIEAMPKAQRDAIVLYDVLGFSLQEIAKITDKSPNAIKQNLFRARNSVREVLNNTSGDVGELGRMATLAATDTRSGD